MAEPVKMLEQQLAEAIAEPLYGIIQNEPKKINKGEETMLEFEEDVVGEGCNIRVVGVGGGGGNAVNYMASAGLNGVEFVAINTDSQVLRKSKAGQTLQIGHKLTRGLGSGGNPEIGRRAFDEDKAKVAELIAGSDMLFITAGMGGGTGTGAAPMVADLAREMNILTVAVVTKPFEWEGRKRMVQAEEGIRELKDKVDTLIVIPNQRVLAVVGKQTRLTESFRIIDDVLLKATRGISDLITTPGLVNVDFADVRSVMMERGDALMGVGVSSGENRSITAAEEAISNTLLEGVVSIKGAKAILLNISASDDLSLTEVDEVAKVIRSSAGDDANLIFGAVVDPEAGDNLTVTVIATGLGSPVTKKEKDLPEGNRIDFTQTFRKSDLASGSFQRKEPAQTATFVTKGQVNAVKIDDLEMPTFMRRLMD
jgi:cell division protein FtsZ